MSVNIGRVFCLLFLIFNCVELKTLIWRFDVDIANPDNWIGGKLAANCKGLHFAPVNSAPVFITQLTTPELTLPINGEIDIIDGGFIEFKDNKKCIKLKALDYHNWYDSSSWSQTEDNVATPDEEQIPCDTDEVIFPNIFHSRVFENYGQDIIVKSAKFEKETDKLRELLGSKILYKIFTNPYGDLPRFITSAEKCKDPYGCLCHSSIYVSCPDVLLAQKEKLNCLNPIMPEEFCREICGAYITYKPGSGPTLNEIQKKLKEYSVDTYASRVKDYMNNELIQVVFSEKEYTGRSLEEAEIFNQYLKSSNAKNLQFLKSGEFQMVGESSKTLAIVFGTFVVVATFFGILLYMNGNTQITSFINRFNTSRGSVFVPFFARFDNTDENLIIDGQSDAGSILDIPKSFDNPLYGQSSPSTTSTLSSSTTIQHENPLYDIVKEEKEDEPEE